MCLHSAISVADCVRVCPAVEVHLASHHHDDDAGPDAASVTDSLYLENRGRSMPTTVAVEAMLRPELSLNGMSAI